MYKRKNVSLYTARDLSLIGIFTALTAVLAQIAIPLPISPVPVSVGFIAVYMAGMLLNPRDAVLSQICYLLLGAVGVPVFGNFRGGLTALFGPTGGYLLVYPIMSGIVAFALNSRKNLSNHKIQRVPQVYFVAAVSICIAHAALYLGGTSWLSIISGIPFREALVLAVLPFVPLDIVKILFCIFALVPLRSRLISMNLLSLDCELCR